MRFTIGSDAYGRKRGEVHKRYNAFLGCYFLWGVLLFDSKEVEMCLYSCQNCDCLTCRGKAENTLKRFRIRYQSVDKTHSVAYRFTNPNDALMALEALKWAGIIKARIAFPI